jgi:Domain of unknown function (DUF4124)
MKRRIFSGLAVFPLAFAVSAALGEIYTWTDTRGTAHYANSEYDIPVRYRAKAKVLDLGIENRTDTASPQPAGQPPPQGSVGNVSPKEKVRLRNIPRMPKE